MLPPESAEPGPWRSDRVPFTRDIVRAIDDPRYDTVVWVTASQTAKTESIFNIIGKRFSDGPRVPTLYVGPTRKQVSSVMNDRLAKMIRTTPALWSILAHGQADKTTEKFLAGVRLGGAWAGSATELASHPAGLVLVDERDRMEGDVDGEGDPVELCRGRIKTYAAGTLAVFSTPTVKGASPVWALFEEGTMHKWAWPCPHCGDRFVPQLSLLHWPEGADAATAAALAFIACPHCGGEIHEQHKRRANERGVFIPHTMGADGEHVPCEAPRDTRTASFWVSGLASPWAKIGDLAYRLVSAQASKEQDRIQTVINVQFGELYELRGAAPEVSAVEALRRDYEPQRYPAGVQMITLGADVQKRGIFYTVRGWGHQSRSWLIDHGYLAGETEYDDVWLTLQRILEAPIYAASDHADPLYIARAFIDSGYRPGSDRFRRPDHRVYEFCRRVQSGRLAYPTKGRDNLPRPLQASDIDITLQGRLFEQGIRLWHVDTDHFKSWLHSRIERDDDDREPDWLLHQHVDEDYCRQLVSEELIVKPNGRRVWICAQGRANHYFDCEVLARAAAVSLAVHTLQPQDTAAPRAPRATPRAPASGFVRRPDGGFFRR